MSEQDVIDGAEEIIEKPEVKETPKPSRADWQARQEEKASKSGWKDFDAYVEEGGDPDKWKTADAFNTYGELIGTVKRQKQEFEQRLEGVQRLSEAQLSAQREQLLKERDAAIEAGGKDAAKEVRALDKQIQATYVAPTQQVDATLEEWNAENQWIKEKTPKAIYARAVWAELLQAQTPIPQALKQLEADIKKHYPPPAAKPVTLPEGERGSGPKGFGKGGPKAATMDSLTSEEAAIWKHSGHMWKNDQKAFLQSVNDLRKGDK
jgi:hypothetical protein